MKFSLKWLREYLNFSCTLDHLSNSLTQIGLEVENINNPYNKLEDFKVCIIKSLKKHPFADKLKICEVFDGKESFQVVCGAKNARENLVTVLAPIGSYLPSLGEFGGMKIKKSVIREIESNGMLCSDSELGLSNESDGIIELEKNTEIGKSFSMFQDEELISLEIAITPNRPDCAGVLGIARDLQALGIGKLKERKRKRITEKFKSDVKLLNKLENSDCPQFYLRLIKNVENKISPQKMQKRFNVSGLKIISSLVDITNFLSIDRCRPLHVFDFDKISGEIVIRHSNQGEKFRGLDGIEYTLDDEMIVICDDLGVISLGGVMGGERTACTQKTKNVLIESAFFTPQKIAHAGRKLSIESDARYRFERGIDPASTLEGIHIASEMITENCGGEVGSIIEGGKYRKKEALIKLKLKDINDLIGHDFESSFVESKLKLLGCEVKYNNDIFSVIPPSWRHDIKIKEDLIEEVGRLFGYENIEIKPLENSKELRRIVTNETQKQKKNICRRLVSLGLTELITWSFVDEKYEQYLSIEREPIRISNPISSELSCLRSTLLTNHLLAVKKNLKRGYSDLGFFEIGPVFYGNLPGEQNDSVLGIRCGEEVSKEWHETSRKSDLFDIKADLFNIMESLNFSEKSLKVDINEIPKYLHPRKSGRILIGNKLLGYFGYIHPKITKLFDIEIDVVCFEINLTETLKFYKKRKISRAEYIPSPFQTSKRDFSFILDKETLSSELINTIRKVDQTLIKNIKIFDYFEGDDIEKGKKALAIQVVIQSEEKTLTDDDLEKLSNNIIKSVEKNCDARLRY